MCFRSISSTLLVCEVARFFSDGSDFAKTTEHGDYVTNLLHAQKWLGKLCITSQFISVKLLKTDDKLHEYLMFSYQNKTGMTYANPVNLNQQHGAYIRELYGTCELFRELAEKHKMNSAIKI